MNTGFIESVTEICLPLLVWKNHSYVQCISFTQVWNDKIKDNIGTWKCCGTEACIVYNQTFLPAPVKSVDITVADKTLTCSSKGIYPAPGLDWSTVPNSDVKAEKTDTQTDAQGLYSISSTVESSGNTFVCKITAGASFHRASLRQQSKQLFHLFHMNTSHRLHY